MLVCVCVGCFVKSWHISVCAFTDVVVAQFVPRNPPPNKTQREAEARMAEKAAAKGKGGHRKKERR